MKLLFVLLFLVSCAPRVPKFSQGDCVLIEPEPFQRNIYASSVFEIREYDDFRDYGEIKYLGLSRQGYEWFYESQIKQTVTCPFEE
jgi:hypothetical protein